MKHDIITVKKIAFRLQARKISETFYTCYLLGFVNITKHIFYKIFNRLQNTLKFK